MTNEKYDEMLINFGELLKEKKSELWWKDFEIGNLKKQLERAEEQIKELKATEQISFAEIEKVGE